VINGRRQADLEFKLKKILMLHKQKKFNPKFDGFAKSLESH
jgi:hypothetical protein